MAERHHIFLIPGFFGFANLGEVKYFAHVRSKLESVFERRHLETQIVYVRTLPTASLRKRAARLADTIAEHATNGGPIHLIGHSSGGLDARLYTTPGVSLPTAKPFEADASRVRSVVTIASPHFGTPQVNLFASALGKHVLRTLSILTLHGIRLGSVPLPALVALAGALPRLGHFQGPLTSILDQVYGQLLRDFDEDRQKELEKFFKDTGSDPALLPQLSPEAMDVFNATTRQRDDCRYGCVVSRGRPPALRSTLALGLSPSAQAIYAIYRALYALAAEFPRSAVPELSNEQRRALHSAYGTLPGERDNDAIVPTLSQVYGEIIDASWSDHLDVIGHFADRNADPPHVDWLATASDFGPEDFRSLWERVATFLVDD